LILVLLVFIPQQVIITGIALSIIVVLYLLLNSFLSFSKEFIITIGYVGGVLLPSEISVEQLLYSPTILLCFFITVLFNVLVFSYFDFETDRMENKKSFVRMIGLNQVHFLFTLLFLLQLGLSITHQTPAVFLLIAMTSIMAGILYFKDSIGLSMCRIIGEAVFLLPGFYWAFT
jgi:4-hydroxybenzoate polyprenyltransferase